MENKGATMADTRISEEPISEMRGNDNMTRPI